MEEGEEGRGGGERGAGLGLGGGEGGGEERWEQGRDRGKGGGEGRGGGRLLRSMAYRGLALFQASAKHLQDRHHVIRSPKNPQ